MLLSMCTLPALQSRAAEPCSAGFNDDFADEQGQVVQYDGEQYIRVNSPRQFLRSFISGKNILVAKFCTIDLSAVLEDPEWWQHNNPYFKWLSEEECVNLRGQNIVSEEVFDGRQLTVWGYHDIKIKGEGYSSIMVDPRYAFCLRFVDCSNISISNLTIGHSEDGNCRGGVIGLTACSGISITDCDLFGCGTYGIQADDSRDITMTHSAIRDCSYGIMLMNNVQRATFNHCNFFRNRQYALVEGTDTDLSFNDCRFYANNPTSILFAVDRPFTLSQCSILHPGDMLGTIELAREKGCYYADDPNDVACFGEGEYNPFIAAGWGYEKVKVDFSGSKPSILDFIYATNPDEIDGEFECAGWVHGWNNYLRTKQPGQYESYIVDEANGYVRIETADDRGDIVVYHDFCFWNCDDGRHRLYAEASGVLEKGKPISTECTGITFYIYDNESRLITYLDVEEPLIPYATDEGLDIAYMLPRNGKDVTYLDENGRRGTYRWNGRGFGSRKIDFK